MRKILKKEIHCVWFIAHTNKDYEEFWTIDELCSETERYVTLFVFNKYCNCVEPYSGYPANTPNVIGLLKKDMTECIVYRHTS